jgi:anthranilate/para-aminobenzoate synthase component II
MAELLRVYHNQRSFLGICLGHQAIAETFGMKLVALETVRHGIKTIIRIIKPFDYIFEGVPSEFSVGLYHSWKVCYDSKTQGSSPDLRITALSHDGIIMSVAHVRYDIRGVQFHPESFMSEYGNLVVQNWIKNLSCR